MKRVLGLRTVDERRQSYAGFQWPAAGKVVAPDWNTVPVCGYGLHALLWGIGDGQLLNWSRSAIWQAVWINPDTIINLCGDKVKFPECEIAIDGTREEVVRFMAANGADATRMVGGIVVDPIQAAACGYRGKAVTTRVFGHAVANGCNGHALSEGAHSSATANGDYGQAVTLSGYGVAAANGGSGIAVSNESYGQAFANGLSGRAVANGLCGQATALNEHGVATANGRGGKAYASYAASAGVGGTIILSRFDDKKGRPELVVGYVGEDGIEPCVYYSVAGGKLTPYSVSPTVLRSDFIDIKIL